MGKHSFKTLVKNSCERACFRDLMEEKKKLSKGRDIVYTTLETQKYLSSDSGLSLDNMRRIYHVRCRELPLKNNFPSAFKDESCLLPSCTFKDSQEHIFSSGCFSTDSEREILNLNLKYKDIFSSDVHLQVIITNIMYSKLEKRKKIITLGKGFPLDPSRVPKLGIQKAKMKMRMQSKNKSKNPHKQTN